MFGDYYWYYDRHQDGISISNPTPVEGQHGLWFRRIYFTYDFTYNDKLTTRFRLEANSNGDFTGGDLTPYVKDAYLKWTYKGSQKLTFGIHPTLTFDWLDGFWGLRHIEKTPADLYRLDSSRDFGVTVDGPTPVDGLTYAVQFGNESGNGSETQEGKILRVEGRYERHSRLALEGFYSFGTRPDERASPDSAGHRGLPQRRRPSGRSVSVAAAPIGPGRCPSSDDLRSGQASACGSSSRRKPTCFSAPTA